MNSIKFFEKGEVKVKENFIKTIIALEETDIEINHTTMLKILTNIASNANYQEIKTSFYMVLATLNNLNNVLNTVKSNNPSRYNELKFLTDPKIAKFVFSLICFLTPSVPSKIIETIETAYSTLNTELIRARIQQDTKSDLDSLITNNNNKNQHNFYPDTFSEINSAPINPIVPYTDDDLAKNLAKTFDSGRARVPVFDQQITEELNKNNIDSKIRNRINDHLMTREMFIVPDNIAQFGNREIIVNLKDPIPTSLNSPKPNSELDNITEIT